MQYKERKKPRKKQKPLAKKHFLMYNKMYIIFRIHNALA
jgi:hypothetical protein